MCGRWTLSTSAGRKRNESGAPTRPVRAGPGNRCAAAAREFLEPLHVDVRVATDAAAQRDCAPVAGVGIVLIAENDALARGAERDASSQEGDASPEALGEGAARALVAEVKSGGCVDAATQPLLLTLMACGADDSSSCVLGPLTARAISQLRLVKNFWGDVPIGAGGGAVKATCLGAGFKASVEGGQPACVSFLRRTAARAEGRGAPLERLASRPQAPL